MDNPIGYLYRVAQSATRRHTRWHRRSLLPVESAIPTPPGVVLISATTPETTASCSPEQPLPESVVTIGPAVDDTAFGVPTTVGTLSAVQIPPKCIGCPPVYQFDTPYQVTVSGPDAEQVLATFTDSGLFSIDREAQVSLGTSPLVPSCAPVMNFDLAPGDGMWMRSTVTSIAQLDGTPIAHGLVDGLDVTVVRIHRRNGDTPSPVLDLIVKKGDTTIWVSLGVGTDTSIARSILRSLHAY